MRRETMIEALVVDSLVRILDRNRVMWLNEILEQGFKGYAHMSDQELQREFTSRGLSLGDIEIPTDDGLPCDDDADDPNLLQTRMEHNRRDARAFEAS
ncbi:MAG: hypothetical protein HZA64_12360 [Rhodocyclales bacterium]|jgi:hypothetical protein|nr:hypothetical protein [Rhodocyclales bacterium]MBI5786240.1 hypothetical protein [Rhodocyclales bacterium]